MDCDHLGAGRIAPRDVAEHALVVRASHQRGEARHAGVLADGVVAPSLLLGLLARPGLEEVRTIEAKFLGEHGLPAICTLKAALRVWPQAPGHSNSVLRYWLEDEGKLSLDFDKAMPPHRAGPDAYVTAHILKALLEAGATGKEMVAWTREPRVLPTCPIGKFRGRQWADVEGGFLSWMLTKDDMEADLKWNAQREIDRRSGR